ncbi:cardiomyopathy-associated protein 5-like [Acanthaster planci]|uniref:Cardiomyopathy-associated protein 5-like n=1 Tax=Acanthaster planci TaxID=133434 RepID=A0A8B7ZSF2_ACAPL|nr:cardiomyopathy-associated protein 5-like [Acanthaster planci]
MRSISVILAAGAIGAGIAGFAVFRRLASRSQEEIAMETALRRVWKQDEASYEEVGLNDIKNCSVRGVLRRTDPRLALQAISGRLKPMPQKLTNSPDSTFETPTKDEARSSSSLKDHTPLSGTNGGAGPLHYSSGENARNKPTASIKTQAADLPREPVHTSVAPPNEETSKMLNVENSPVDSKHTECTVSSSVDATSNQTPFSPAKRAKPSTLKNDSAEKEQAHFMSSSGAKSEDNTSDQDIAGDSISATEEIESVLASTPKTSFRVKSAPIEKEATTQNKAKGVTSSQAIAGENYITTDEGPEKVPSHSPKEDDVAIPSQLKNDYAENEQTESLSTTKAPVMEEPSNQAIAGIDYLSIDTETGNGHFYCPKKDETSTSSTLENVAPTKEQAGPLITTITARVKEDPSNQAIADLDSISKDEKIVQVPSYTLKRDEARTPSQLENDSAQKEQAESRSDTTATVQDKPNNHSFTDENCNSADEITKTVPSHTLNDNTTTPSQLEYDSTHKEQAGSLSTTKTTADEEPSNQFVTDRNYESNGEETESIPPHSNQPVTEDKASTYEEIQSVPSYTPHETVEATSSNLENDPTKVTGKDKSSDQGLATDHISADEKTGNIPSYTAGDEDISTLSQLDSDTAEREKAEFLPTKDTVKEEPSNQAVADKDYKSQDEETESIISSYTPKGDNARTPSQLEYDSAEKEQTGSLSTTVKEEPSNQAVADKDYKSTDEETESIISSYTPKGDNARTPSQLEYDSAEKEQAGSLSTAIKEELINKAVCDENYTSSDEEKGSVPSYTPKNDSAKKEQAESLLITNTNEEPSYQAIFEKDFKSLDEETEMIPSCSPKEDNVTSPSQLEHDAENDQAESLSTSKTTVEEKSSGSEAVAKDQITAVEETESVPSFTPRGRDTPTLSQLDNNPLEKEQAMSLSSTQTTDKEPRNQAVTDLDCQSSDVKTVHTPSHTIKEDIAKTPSQVENHAARKEQAEALSTKKTTVEDEQSNHAVADEDFKPDDEETRNLPSYTPKEELATTKSQLEHESAEEEQAEFPSTTNVTSKEDPSDQAIAKDHKTVDDETESIQSCSPRRNSTMHITPSHLKNNTAEKEQARSLSITKVTGEEEPSNQAVAKDSISIDEDEETESGPTYTSMENDTAIPSQLKNVCGQKQVGSLFTTRAMGKDEPSSQAITKNFVSNDEETEIIPSDTLKEHDLAPYSKLEKSPAKFKGEVKLSINQDFVTDHFFADEKTGNDSFHTARDDDMATPSWLANNPTGRQKEQARSVSTTKGKGHDKPSNQDIAEDHISADEETEHSSSYTQSQDDKPGPSQLENDPTNDKGTDSMPSANTTFDKTTQLQSMKCNIIANKKLQTGSVSLHITDSEKTRDLITDMDVVLADSKQAEYSAVLSTSTKVKAQPCEMTQHQVKVLKIKNGLMGRVIGKKGKHLKHVNQHCNVKTNYGRLDEKHHFLHLEGTANSIQLAKDFIQKHVETGILEIPVNEIDGLLLTDKDSTDNVMKNYYSTNRQYGRVVGHNGKNLKELRKLGVKVDALSVSGLKCLSLTGTATQVQTACQWIQDHLSPRLFEPAPVPEPLSPSPSMPESEQPTIPALISNQESSSSDVTKARMD